MVVVAPRVSPGLLAEIERLATRDLSFAEMNRRVGRKAEALALPRPSYQTVRVLARAARERRQGPDTLEVLADVAFRVRPPEALLDHAAGVPLPKLR